MYRLIFSTLFIILFVSYPSAQVINKMDFNRFTHYRLEDWITYAPAADVTSIDIGDDYVYFGTRYGGILRYQLYDHQWDFPFTTSSGLRSNRIINMSFDYNTHRLYAQTPRGIDMYNSAFQYWQPAGISSLPPRRQPSPDEIADYQKEKNYRFPAYYRPSLNELPNFFTDRNFVFQPPDEILDPWNRVFHLNGAREMGPFRTLWLSTDGLGPAHVDMDSYTLEFEQRSLTNIRPRDLFFDRSAIWIGGKSFGPDPSGINKWNDRKDKWAFIEARYHSNIYNDNVNVVEGNKHFLFFGTDLGLIRYDKKQREWLSFSTAQRLHGEQVTDLLFKNQTLFIATDEGFNWMEPSGNHISRSQDRKLDNTRIYKIASVDSMLLLATPYGIYQYDIQKDKIYLFQTKSAIMDANITALKLHGDSLWIAGQTGIAVYDTKKDRWTSFTQIQSQLNTTFHDIAFTEPYVWFACDEGLLRYDTSRDYWYLYTTRDGLASNRVYHIDVDGDDLWLSTEGGITIFRWYSENRIE